MLYQAFDVCLNFKVRVKALKCDFHNYLKERQLRLKCHTKVVYTVVSVWVGSSFTNTAYILSILFPYNIEKSTSKGIIHYEH